MNIAHRYFRSLLEIPERQDPAVGAIDFSSSLVNGEVYNSNICYGGSSKGGGSSNTTTSTMTPPANVMAAYNQALGMANTAASAPLQQYQGQTVAQLNPTEQSAFGTINNAQGAAQPFINGAQNLIQQGTQPLWNGVQQFSPQNVQQYMSPYTGQVLNSAVAQQQNTDAQQQAALQGNAISSGAWGGDRAGVASAVLSGQQDLANNQTNAGILNQGYTQGLGEFNTQQQAQLGANEANSYLNQQGAFGMANLGQEALGTQLTGANAQLAAGQQQQQQAQANLNVPYQQFLQQQAYPFQTAQYYANIAEGIGGNSGGTSTTTSPGASTTSQVAGLGLGGLGILGATGAFGGSGGSPGWMSNLFSTAPAAARGGVAKGYAPGGAVTPGQLTSVSGIPDLSVDFIPSSTGNAGHAMGVPQAPKPTAQPSAMSQLTSPQGLSSLTQLAKTLGGSGVPSSTSVDNSNVGGFGNVFGSGSGVDASTGNSLATQNSINSSFLSSGDVGSSGIDFSGFGSFAKGGPVQRKGYYIGGQVLPDIVSGVGDVVGTFFGDPMAGDQGVGLMGSLDGGRTYGQGDVSQIMGAATNTENAQGNGLNGAGGAGMTGMSMLMNMKRGGTARGYDDGGQVGGMSPTGSALASQQTPSMAGNLNNMTPEQLQQYVMRLPMGSPQQKQVASVLQQKRMMPNVGAPAVGGFGAQQPAMARGGKAYADGGDIPNPPTPDQIARQMDVQDDVNQDAPASPVGAMGSNQLAAPAPQQESAAPVEPTAVVPNAMGMARPAAAEDTQEAKHRDPNPWLALAEAGFGMAAGNSPHAMQNIGAGALVGLKNYGEQQKESDTVNDAADKLMQEAKQHKDQIAVEQQQADTQKQNVSQTGTYQTGELAARARASDIQDRNDAAMRRIQQQQADNATLAMKQKELVKDQFGNPMGWADPTSGKIIPIAGMPGASSSVPPNVTPSATSSSAASEAPQSETQPAATNNLPPEMQAKLAQVAPNQRDQAIIAGVIEGRIPPTKQYLGSNPQAYLSAAAQVDPTFDTANPTARMKTAADYSPAGQSGKLITSLNTASRHAAATALAGIDLNNTSGLPYSTTFNSAANSLEAGAGDPRVGNYGSYLGNYGHEAMKVISGKASPGEAETEDFMKPMDSSGSTAQILGALSAKNGMMLSRAEEMQRQHDAAMGPYGQHIQVVSPDAQQAFQDMDTLYAAARDGKMNTPVVAQARQRLETYARPVMGNKPAGTPTAIVPSPKDIDYLRSNPAAAAKFNGRFGDGAAEKLLGQQ